MSNNIKMQKLRGVKKKCRRSVLAYVRSTDPKYLWDREDLPNSVDPDATFLSEQQLFDTSVGGHKMATCPSLRTRLLKC